MSKVRRKRVFLCSSIVPCSLAFRFEGSVFEYENLFITVRLTFLAHSFRMRPKFQVLPWFECDGLGEDELLIRFFLLNC